jgi:nucleotide sugar dehydrogenase
MEPSRLATRRATAGETDAPTRSVVCVQGLGFVGTAMALAVASARLPDAMPAYDVVGVELDTPEGLRKAESINAGKLPIRSADPKMESALAQAVEARNLCATTDPSAYESASVVLVDIHLDLSYGASGAPEVDFSGLKAAIRTLAERMPAGSLIVIETTVPPGTCEKVIGPEIDRVVAERGMEPDSILLAHSYERVMPGADYLDSIVNFWRVYAGRTPAAAEACERFLSAVVNVEAYPLTRLSSTTASETGKVLENSYRATTIAFMEEWGRFAEAVGIDLFEVISAIRQRPTHSNMRQPGFGVGGYCLPKDPLFAQFAAAELFELPELDFPFAKEAVRTNEAMPLVTVDKLDELLGGLQGKRVLLLGMAYREGVGDTRFSPSASFVEAVTERGGEVTCHDPIADGDAAVKRELPAVDGFDALVLAVSHAEYVGMDFAGWLGSSRPLVLDANNVLDTDRLRALAGAGCRVWAIGRGAVEARQR